MRFMNTWEIDEAQRAFADHPVLGPASRTLAGLRDAVDANSDGWAYWPKPVRAAERLIALIEGPDRYPYGRREDATPAALRKAYTPVKAFRTRSGLDFPIEEP